jgi:hypothetical protein
MKNGFLIFLCFLFFNSVFAHSTDNDQHGKLKFAPLEVMLSKSVATGFLKVVPGEIVGFRKRPSERQRIEEAFKVIEAVINSEEFKNKVISYEGEDGHRRYTANNDLTNEAIYEKLMQGKELLNGEETLGEMNLDIKRYSRFWSKVIGWTSPGNSKWINVNGRFYKKYSVAQIASNLTHEWIHLNGFYHASAKDHDSVPYAVGYIMEDLALKYLSQGYLD